MARRDSVTGTIYSTPRNGSPQPYRIKDISLAPIGSREIRQAENEMPGLMKIRDQYASTQPLSGARITVNMHISIKSAVLLETLMQLGAQVRCSSCDILSTYDPAAAAIAQLGINVFAWKGQTPIEQMECMEMALKYPNGNYPTMVMDENGGMTIFMHESQYNILKTLYGVTVNTTTGVLDMIKLHNNGQLKTAVFNINSAITKCQAAGFYGCRESLVDAIKRTTSIMIAGKVAVVAGYGEVGKGVAQSLKSLGARVIITEIDPITALQAAMEGYEVTDMEDACKIGRIFVTATGCRDVIRGEHLYQMPNNALVCNMGMNDVEIDIDWLSQQARTTEKIGSQVDRYELDNGKSIILLANGRWVNHVCAQGHPSFVMSVSLTNQVLAQMELFTNKNKYGIGIHNIPKLLEERVAKLHLEYLGVKLTKLTSEQALYMNVNINGPYKPENYRY